MQQKFYFHSMRSTFLRASRMSFGAAKRKVSLIIKRGVTDNELFLSSPKHK